MYALIENEQIVQYVSGFIPNGDYIEVPDYVAENLGDYDYKDGAWVQIVKPVPTVPLEQRIAELEAIIDAMLNGGETV